MKASKRFQFSPDDTQALRNELARFDKKQVDAFIAGLQSLCGITTHLMGLKSAADHRSELNRMK